ncbi:hypothetical protein NIES37_01760 [Tolypothrix tenuis PCC 7101]|uniref:Uncharacterized protein n=1 Tax=Tolypothrix tenuis PCC 7101 TaxID=231146 RepID=A0A1Z4MRY3_9CYAN|nr:hypothetical protein NIES37_01760 [Tolypothrix tenuis PCC 7101]BAZ73246.1 hypothetical protein NIES50_18080 [Aulosira laxa NIES-50]
MRYEDQLPQLISEKNVINYDYNKIFLSDTAFPPLNFGNLTTFLEDTYTSNLPNF